MEHRSRSGFFDELEALTAVRGALSLCGRLQHVDIALFLDNEASLSTLINGSSESPFVQRLLLDLAACEEGGRQRVDTPFLCWCSESPSVSRNPCFRFHETVLEYLRWHVLNVLHAKLHVNLAHPSIDVSFIAHDMNTPCNVLSQGHELIKFWGL